MKALMAVYNFFVGDMIILVGIVVTLLVLLLINNVAAFEPIRAYSGVILIVVTLAVLSITLGREVRGREKSS